MSWDRLEAAAWLASDSSGAGNDNAEGHQTNKDKRAVLMQAGTGDAEVLRTASGVHTLNRSTAG